MKSDSISWMGANCACAKDHYGEEKKKDAPFVMLFLHCSSPEMRAGGRFDARTLRPFDAVTEMKSLSLTGPAAA